MLCIKKLSMHTGQELTLLLHVSLCEHGCYSKQEQEAATRDGIDAQRKASSSSAADALKQVTSMQ